MVRLALILAACLVAPPAFAQERPAPVAAPSTPDEGIPVESALVRSACGGCHHPDEKNRMTRISYRRSTPENWENTVKRMISLNHAKVEPAQAREIVKYLADNHGLAPAEAKAIAFESERRLVDRAYEADKETSVVCSSCHSIGRVMSERRTKQEWELLLAMHRGYYPGVDSQPMNDGTGFRRGARRAPEGAEPVRAETGHPMDRIITHLSAQFPLRTAEWTAWAAAMQPPMLAGRWAISGSAPGKGPIVGQVVVAVDPSVPDTFTTDTRFTFVRTGESVTRKGRAVVYTGFQWRGRGTVASPDDVWREVLAVDRTRREMSGRWFTGAYDELGMDVRLVKLAADPVVLGASVASLKTAVPRAGVRLYGANLPPKLTIKDISLGQGITVSRIVSATPDVVTIDVDVAAAAKAGARDITIAGATSPSALVVFDKVDSIKVLPIAGLARLGGVVHPKQLQQFEAVAFNNGVNLGIVDVKWSLEEYAATFGDDDTRYVGVLDEQGLFTPSLDGPNPQRSGERNNVGDVWVVADLSASPALGLTKPLRARAQLIVSVPIYMRWWTSAETVARGGTQ
jgi:quinohemoprotein amine dehydrogenase